MTPADLLTYVTEGAGDFLTAQMREWLLSKRFRAFAEEHRDKLRKKRRGVRDQEGLRDLGAEWDTAFRLVQERRFAVGYETCAATEGRGPDFTVTFRALTFNVEVTRIHRAVGKIPPGAKVMNTVCAKVPQMPPSAANVLWLAGADPDLSPADLDQALTCLEARLQARDDVFFTDSGFRGASDFRAQSRRLSGVLFRGHLRHTARARHPLPPDVCTILRKLSA